MAIKSSDLLRSALQATIQHCKVSSDWVPSTNAYDDNRSSVLGHYITEHWALSLGISAKDAMLFCSKKNFTTLLNVPRAERGYFWDYTIATSDFSRIHAAAEIEMGKRNYKNDPAVGKLDGLQQDFVKLVYAHVPARAFVARVQSDQYRDRLEDHARELARTVSANAAPGYIDVFLVPTADRYARSLYGRIEVSSPTTTRWHRPLDKG
jgi:hypothetical protein